jgi:acetolactate synthase-1/2/3 large subunit
VRWGWEGLFVYGGVAPLALALLIALTVGEPPRLLAREKPAWNRVGALFSGSLRARTLLFCALNVTNLFANYGLASWLPTLLVQNGWSLAAASRVTSVLAIGGLAGGFIVSGLADRGRIGLGFGGAYLLVACSLAFCATDPSSTLVWMLLRDAGPARLRALPARVARHGSRVRQRHRPHRFAVRTAGACGAHGSRTAAAACAGQPHGADAPVCGPGRRACGHSPPGGPGNRSGTGGRVTGPGMAGTASPSFTGAASLLHTMAAAGIEVCFANPGTSEMHFVSALGAVPQIRPLLGLFEGAVSGMADGYARVAGKPALTLYHLGTGFTNAAANLHNARRAKSPVVNVVGDHATTHKRWDSPLKSDIEALARPLSDWLRMAQSTHTLSADAAAAVAAARSHPGQIATLIMPADVAWGTTTGHAAPRNVAAPAHADPAAIARIAAMLRDHGSRCALIIRAAAGDPRALAALHRICAATGARPLHDMMAPRVLRGADQFAVQRVGYRAEDAVKLFEGVSDVVLVGAPPPVAPFAYPRFPSWLTPDDSRLAVLAHEHEDEVQALEALADALGAPALAGAQGTDAAMAARNELLANSPRGRLDAAVIGRSLARHMPEGAIFSEEAISNGPPIAAGTALAAPHWHLTNTGGALGQGIPVATGAAVAAPGRKVINVQADGSALFTLQALWTQAREQLDVVTIILANRSYAVLRFEIARVGAKVDETLAGSLLDIDRPDIDWVALARGLGVEATRVTTAEAFDDVLRTAIHERGPRLIEAVLDR